MPIIDKETKHNLGRLLATLFVIIFLFYLLLICQGSS